MELTDDDRSLSLQVIIGLLQDGETYSTKIKQREKPSDGKLGKWEHELVCERYEEDLIMQLYCFYIRYLN